MGCISGPVFRRLLRQQAKRTLTDSNGSLSIKFDFWLFNMINNSKQTVLINSTCGLIFIRFAFEFSMGTRQRQVRGIVTNDHKKLRCCVWIN